MLDRQMKPKGLAVFHGQADLGTERLITATAAREAYQLLVANQFLATSPFKLPPLPISECDFNLGEPRTCFYTTDYCVENFGGSIQYGWNVIEINFRSGENEYGHLEMGAHAIWISPSGEPMEVIDHHHPLAKYGSFKRIVGFLPHQRVKHGCGATINFVDEYGDGRFIETLDRCELSEVRI